MSEHQVDIVDTINKESSCHDEDISGSAFEDHSDTSALMELAELACQSSTTDASTNFQQALPAPLSVNFSNSCHSNQNNDSTDNNCDSAMESLDNSTAKAQLYQSPSPIPATSLKEDKMLLSNFSTLTEEIKANVPCQFETFNEMNNEHQDKKASEKEILNQNQTMEINVQKSFELATSDPSDASSTSKICLQKISQRKKSVSIFDNSDSSGSDDSSIEDNLINTQKDISDAKPNTNEVKYSLSNAEKAGYHNDEKINAYDVINNDSIIIAKEHESDCIKVNHSTEDLKSIRICETGISVSCQIGSDLNKLLKPDIDKILVSKDQQSTETVLRNVSAVNKSPCKDKAHCNDVINNKIEECVTLDNNIKHCPNKGRSANFFNKDIKSLRENFDKGTASYQTIECADTIQDGSIDSINLSKDPQECKMSLDEDLIMLEANKEQNNDKTPKFSDFCEKEPSACAMEKKGYVQSVLGDDTDYRKFSMEVQSNNLLESCAVNSGLKLQSIRTFLEPEIGEDVDNHDSSAKNDAHSSTEKNIENNSESNRDLKTDSGDNLEIKSEDVSLISGSTVETMHYTDMSYRNTTKCIDKMLKNCKSTRTANNGNEAKEERGMPIVENDDLLKLNSRSSLDIQISEENISITTESVQLDKNLLTDIVVKDDNEGRERKIDKDIAVERENNFELGLTKEEEDCLDLDRNKPISNLVSDFSTGSIQQSHFKNSVTSNFILESVHETINVNNESSIHDKIVELATATDSSCNKDNLLGALPVFNKKNSVTSNDDSDSIIDNLHTCETSTVASAVTNCKNISDTSMISSDICKDLSLKDTVDCCKKDFNTNKETFDFRTKEDMDTTKDIMENEKYLSDSGKNDLFPRKIMLDRPTHDTIESFESLDTRPIKGSSNREVDLVPSEISSDIKQDTLDSCSVKRNPNDEGFKDSIAVSSDLYSCKDVLNSTYKALETINEASNRSIYANESYKVAMDMSKVVRDASKEIATTINDISNTICKKETLGTIIDNSNTVMDKSGTGKDGLNSMRIESSSNESLLTTDCPHKDVPDSINDSCGNLSPRGFDTTDTNNEIPNSSEDSIDRSNVTSVVNIDISNIIKAISDISRDSSDNNNTGKVASDPCKNDSVTCNSDVKANEVDSSVTKDTLDSAKDDSFSRQDSSDCSKFLTHGIEDVINTCKDVSCVSMDITDARKDISDPRNNTGKVASDTSKNDSVTCIREVIANEVDSSVTKDVSVTLQDSSDCSKCLTGGIVDVINTCKGVSDVNTDITDASKDSSDSRNDAGKVASDTCNNDSVTCNSEVKDNEVDSNVTKDALDSAEDVSATLQDSSDCSKCLTGGIVDVINTCKGVSDVNTDITNASKDSSDSRNDADKGASDTCKNDSVTCNNEVKSNEVDSSVNNDALDYAKDDSFTLQDSSDCSKCLTYGIKDGINAYKGVSDVSTDITDGSKEASNLSTNVSDAKTVVLAVCKEDKAFSGDMSDVTDKNNELTLLFTEKTESTRFNYKDVEQNNVSLNFSGESLNIKKKISCQSLESESLCTRSIQQAVSLESNVGLTVLVNENEKDCDLNSVETQEVTLDQQITLPQCDANKTCSLKEVQAVTSISQSRKRTRTNSLDDNCVVKKVKFSEALHKADAEDSDIDSDLDDPNRLVIIENENEFTHNNSITNVFQEKSIFVKNSSQTDGINPDMTSKLIDSHVSKGQNDDADTASDIEVINVVKESGGVKKYSAEGICKKCCDTWNSNILKLLFEGNESVTIKSKITFGAIICMNNYAKLYYKNKEESAIRKLLHRAGLGLSKNLSSIKISELNFQILARIKNGRMSCCDVFYLLYLVKKGSVNNAVNKNSKLKIDDFITIDDDEPSSEDKLLALSLSTTPVDNETSQEMESISSSHTSNITETEISLSVQTEASQTNKPMAKTIIPKIWEIISQTNNKKFEHLQKIITTERENLSYDVVEFYDQLPCPVARFEKEILTFKQKNLTNIDVLNIYNLFKRDKRFDCNIFFKLLFQIAFLRSRILLIPDSSKLVDVAEKLAESMSDIDNVNFEFDEWDNEHLYSSPICSIPAGKYPTIREILGLFCSWNSKTLLSSQQYKEFNLKSSLLKLFREKVNLNDGCGLCIRLYERYCSLLFQQKEPAKANLYLNLFYLPKKEQSTVKRATVLPHDISFLPPSNQNISKYMKYLNDSGSQPSRLKRKLPDSIVNYKLIQTKKMKTEILNQVKDEKIKSLLNTYSHIHPEVNKGETPVASNDRQLVKSTQSRAMISKMYSILKADNVPNDKIDFVISKVLSIIR